MPGVLNVKANDLSRLQVMKSKSLDGTRTNLRSTTSSAGELATVAQSLLSASLTKCSRDAYKCS